MRISRFLTYSYRLSVCLAMMLGVFQVVSFAQQESSMWDLKTGDDVQNRGRRLIAPDKFLVYGLNREAMKQVLDDAPLEFTVAARMKEVVLEIPSGDGVLQRFRIEDSPVLSPEIAAQYPDWKTYQGFGIDDPTATARFDFTPTGFHAYILSSQGTMLIDPFQENDPGNYIVYYKHDLPSRAENFYCEFDSEIRRDKSPVESPDAPEFSSGTQIRTYRLAMAATAEYTTFFRQPGDTDAQAQTRALNAIVVTVNRVNGIYRRDFAVGLMLVSGTNIIYTNAITDPYANSSNDLAANQTTIDTVIGTANYDFGHLVGTGGGGVAQLGVPCRAGVKAQGLTGSPAPVNDAFDIDYVAHEMGHQMGANHTFNEGTNGSCGGNRNAGTAFEPGSAATIMGYAGICNPANLQRNSIDTFHIGSLTEIVAYRNGTGATCGTVSGSNTIPVLASLTNYSIPFNTPFVLTASATDADGNPLTYSWEELDANLAASNYTTVTDDDDTNLTARPLFRSYVPATANFRNFPALPFILNNSNEPPVYFTGTSPTGIVCSSGTCVTGEDLPSIARVMNFRVAVRDNQGGSADAGMTVNVVNTTTPFRVLTQNTATTWTGNTSQTITWNVSGTTAAPISAANVRISLSTDGGQTFPIILASSTTNDGTESVLIPNAATTQARIKIEAVGNIFFDINDVNFTIVNGAAAPFITPGTINITAESCGIANGQPDPGETLTVSLPLSNKGDVAATNLTATLQATGGVVSAVSQSYGAVAAGDTATRSFTFTVNSNLACGSPVTLTFAIVDGAITYQNATRTYSSGAAGAILTQNFDGVTTPALPSGWTNVQTSGTGINWVTSTTTPNSTPNAAFANETLTVNAAALVSPAITINSPTAQITFRNRFNLEDTYDGTVLEFTINNGATWTDVITGGGSFASGGYTDTISTEDQSPILGRQAWSGNSGGYIDTVVNLPASLNGQSVRFRWLTASDSSVIATGGPGQWVDNVQVIGKVCQTCLVTAATVSISGRVVLPNDFGLTSANVTLTDSSGISQTTATGKFGNFTFREIPSGETYILTVAARRYTFALQIVSPTENLSGITFTPQ